MLWKLLQTRIRIQTIVGFLSSLPLKTHEAFVSDTPSIMIPYDERTTVRRLTDFWNKCSSHTTWNRFCVLHLAYLVSLMVYRHKCDPNIACPLLARALEQFKKRVSKAVFRRVLRLIMIRLPQMVNHTRALDCHKQVYYELVLHLDTPLYDRSSDPLFRSFFSQRRFKPEVVHRYISRCINLGTLNSMGILLEILKYFGYHVGNRELMLHVLTNKAPVTLRGWDVLEYYRDSLVLQPAMLVRLLLHFNPTAKAVLKMPAKYASVLGRIDKESAFQLVSKRLEYYKWFSAEARNNAQFLIRVFREGDSVTDDDDDDDEGGGDFMFPILKYASKSVRSNAQVFQAAATSITFAFQLRFADTSLKKNDAFFTAMLESFSSNDENWLHTPFPFHAFHKTLYNRSKVRALWLAGFKGLHFTSLDSKWRHLREVQIKAVKTNGVWLLSQLPSCCDGQPELRDDQRFLRYMLDNKEDNKAPSLLCFTPEMWRDIPLVVKCIRIDAYDFVEKLERGASHLLEHREIVEALLQRSKRQSRLMRQLNSSACFASMWQSNVNLAVEIAEFDRGWSFIPTMPSRDFALQFGRAGEDDSLFRLAFGGSCGQPFAHRAFLLQLLQEIEWKMRASSLSPPLCLPRHGLITEPDFWGDLERVGLGDDVELCIQLARIQPNTGTCLFGFYTRLPRVVATDAGFLAVWVPKYAQSSNKPRHRDYCSDMITLLRRVMLLPELAHHAVSMASLNTVLRSKRHVEAEVWLDIDLSIVTLGLLQQHGTKLLCPKRGDHRLLEDDASNPKVALTMMKTSPEFYFHLPTNFQHDSYLLSWAFLTPRQHLRRRMREAIIYEYVRREQNERCIGRVHCWLATHGLGFVQSGSAVADVEINWIRSGTGKRKRGVE